MESETKIETSFGSRFWTLLKAIVLGLPAVVLVVLVCAEIVKVFTPKTFILSEISVPEDLEKEGYSARVVSEIVMTGLSVEKENSDNSSETLMIVGDSNLAEVSGKLISNNVTITLGPRLAELDFRPRRKTLLDAKIPSTDLSLQSAISSVIDNFNLKVYEVNISIVKTDGDYSALILARFGSRQSITIVDKKRIAEIKKIPTIEDTLTEEERSDLPGSDIRDLMDAIHFEIGKLVYPHEVGVELVGVAPLELANNVTQLNSDDVFRNSVQYFLIHCAAEVSTGSASSSCKSLERFQQDERARTLLSLVAYLAGDDEKAADYLKTIADGDNKSFVNRLLAGKVKFKRADGTYARVLKWQEVKEPVDSSSPKARAVGRTPR